MPIDDGRWGWQAGPRAVYSRQHSRTPRETAVSSERKPLFRPDVLRQHVAQFPLPERARTFRYRLTDWANLIRTGQADKRNETELLPNFLTHFFIELLGYSVRAQPSWTEN